MLSLWNMECLCIYYRTCSKFLNFAALFPAQYFIMFYPPFFIFNIYQLYRVVTTHRIRDLKNECIYIYELTTDIGSCSQRQKVCLFPNCKEKIPNSGNRNISPFSDILTALYYSKLYFCIPLISELNIWFSPLFGYIKYAFFPILNKTMWKRGCISFVVSYCEFVTFPLVSWVRCGTWLYRFLIFAPLLTLHHLPKMGKKGVTTSCILPWYHWPWNKHIPSLSNPAVVSDPH